MAEATDQSGEEVINELVDRLLNQASTKQPELTREMVAEVIHKLRHRLAAMNKLILLDTIACLIDLKTEE